jgi:hypothetical protein
MNSIITMNSILNTKNNYLILTNNIINSSNVGSLLYMKEKIIDISGNSTYDISWQEILATSFNNIDTYQNRIILSGKINTIATSNGTTSTSCCLITQNNIKNNIKFIFDSSNNKNGKILFVKNLHTSDKEYNYLFNDLTNVLFENKTFYNIHNDLTINNTNTDFNRYIYHFNYYLNDSTYNLNNSNFYKINIRDYLYKYTYEISNNNLLTLDNLDICYNKIEYAITNITNDFSFINVTIESSSTINFNSNNFTTLLIDNSFNNNLDILQKNFNYSIIRNILSYNKLTLDYKHVNYYDFSLNFNFNSNKIYNPNQTSNIIKTFLIKTNNFDILQKMKKNSKIIFGRKNIYLNNIKVLDNTSTLYNTTINFNNNSTTLRSVKDSSNLIFIGLGNQVTGITQHDIYNHTYFSIGKSLITFKKNINTNNINTNTKLKFIKDGNIDKYYLLDFPLSYTSSSINNYNINNTIKFNSELNFYNEFQSNKIFNLNFTDYFNASTNNNYKSSFDNLARINNINNNIYSISSEQVNSAIYVQIKNIIKERDTIKILNKINLETRLILQKDDAGYDLRYNYNEFFYITSKLDLLLALNSLNLANNYGIESYNFDYNLLNFYSLTIGSVVKTSGASDFTNVDCIYIYHDPKNDKDERFLYPNNNIEIKRDNEIDTLSKAIEQYRGTGSRTSTTNAAFVPSQNGSNLSRRMIQGIIGLNNIPKLLSIEPYDPNIIKGRGFINQFQVDFDKDDVCDTSYCDKLAIKQNAIKHDSVKNSRIISSNLLKKQNYANIVRTNVRNKLSQDCITKLQSANPSINIPCNNNTVIEKRTPFVLFNTGRGNYLRG